MGLLPAGPSPCRGSTHTVSCPCHVAMETDLEALNIDWYLLGTCSFLDVVTALCRRERRAAPSPPPCGTMERASFCHREVKIQEKLNGKDVFFPSDNIVVFF